MLVEVQTRFCVVILFSWRLNSMSSSLTRERTERRLRTAIHEAGHVVVGLCLGMKLVDVQLSDEAGKTRFQSSVVSDLLVFGHYNGPLLRRYLIMVVAGPVAAESDAALEENFGEWPTPEDREGLGYCLDWEVDGEPCPARISAYVRRKGLIPPSWDEFSDVHDAILCAEAVSELVNSRKAPEQCSRELNARPDRTEASLEDVAATIARAEDLAERFLKRRWDAVNKLAHSLARRKTGRMSAPQVLRLIGGLLPPAIILRPSR
jgi:hypothetical protein